MNILKKRKFTLNIYPSSTPPPPEPSAPPPPPAPSAPPSPPSSSSTTAQAYIIIFILDYRVFRLPEQLLGQKLRVY